MLISKSTFLHHMKKKKAVKAKHESISLARLSSSSWGILKVIGDRLKWDIYKPLLWAWGPLWNLHAVERGWKTSRGTRCQKTTSAASPSQRLLATEKCKANIYSFRCFWSPFVKQFAMPSSSVFLWMYSVFWLLLAGFFMHTKRGFGLAPKQNHHDRNKKTPFASVCSSGSPFT